MSDVYVYYFVRTGPTGETIQSRRRATLAAINGIGEPLMESQLVVDDTEINASGFVIGNGADECRAMDALWGQIRSLERRASSRDSEALQLDEISEAANIYCLQLESRELRKQAQSLRKKRIDTMIDELGRDIDSQAAAFRQSFS